MYIGIHVKNSLFLSRLNEFYVKFLGRFSKNTEISNLMKIYPMRDDFREKVIDAKMCILIFSTSRVRNTECPTRYRTRHFFNNFTTNEQLGALQTHNTNTFLFISHTTNVLMFKFRCNIFIGVRIITEMPGSVASGTHCICHSEMNSARYYHKCT